MSKDYEDWTDWAGDHPKEAEAELRKGLEQSAAGDTVSLGDFTQYADLCDTEGHEFYMGVCLICSAVDEDFEPSDAQIPGTYEIKRSAA